MKILAGLIMTLMSLTVQANIPVLIYHRVSNDKPAQENISPENLFEHLKIIKSLGFKTVTISELAAYLRGEAQLPEKTVAITFDDGWKTDLVASSLIKSFEMKATFYVMSGMWDDNEWNRAYYLSRDELQRLAAIPGIEIGAHSHVHFTQNQELLPQLDERIMYGEVIMSKLLIEEVIGKPVVSFSWPYGYSRPQIVKQLPKLGFTSGVDVMTGHKNVKGASPFSISRFNVDGSCTTQHIQEMLEKKVYLTCK